MRARRSSTRAAGVHAALVVGLALAACGDSAANVAAITSAGAVPVDAGVRTTPIPTVQDAAPPPTASAPTPTPEPRLANGVAGRACASDTDCPSGRCEHPSGDSAPGYCTRTCVSTAQCGVGGICASVVNAEAAAECFGICRDPRDCREGFTCIGVGRVARVSVPGSCRPKGLVGSVDNLADGVAGKACQAAADCEGGQGAICASKNLTGTSYPGNYCTGRCYEDAQCGQGASCAWPHGSVDAGYCLQTCTTHADCTRAGYRCWEIGDGARILHACYPGAVPISTTGHACKQDTECGPAPARCAAELPYAGLVTNELVTAPAGYCTQRCALDEECGSNAQCINYGTRGGICLVRCTPSAACRAGYECIPHSRDADPAATVCIPRDPTAPGQDQDHDAGT